MRSRWWLQAGIGHPSLVPPTTGTFDGVIVIRIGVLVGKSADGGAKLPFTPPTLGLIKAAFRSPWTLITSALKGEPPESVTVTLTGPWICKRLAARSARNGGPAAAG